MRAERRLRHNINRRSIRMLWLRGALLVWPLLGSDNSRHYIYIYASTLAARTINRFVLNWQLNAAATATTFAFYFHLYFLLRHSFSSSRCPAFDTLCGKRVLMEQMKRSLHRRAWERRRAEGEGRKDGGGSVSESTYWSIMIFQSDPVVLYLVPNCSSPFRNDNVWSRNCDSSL